MASIGIIGSGIAGLHLGLLLQQSGLDPTIYSERTPNQQRARRLTNIVGRNGCTRARERQLGVAHWESPADDMVCIAVTVRGPQTLAFSGRLPSPAQSVDMRLYWARLLEDFSARGGRVVYGTRSLDDVDELSARHDLLVVACGRSSLAPLFPRVAAKSPYAAPQRLVVAGLFRGIARSNPSALEVVVNPGHGEILGIPIQSFEPGLTGIGVEIVEGGAFESLRGLRYEPDPRTFNATLLEVLRDYAPSLYERIDPARFDLSRPDDFTCVAITPTVRRGYIEFSNGKCAMAIGDAHVVVDPITGQGANSASYSAGVLAAAIREADGFDRAFCDRVERQICAYVVPVSDSANARLQPPQPHIGEFLAAAARHQAVADLYSDGFDHPDRFWELTCDPARTAACLKAFAHHHDSAALPG